MSPQDRLTPKELGKLRWLERRMGLEGIAVATGAPKRKVISLLGGKYVARQHVEAVRKRLLN